MSRRGGIWVTGLLCFLGMLLCAGNGWARDEVIVLERVSTPEPSLSLEEIIEVAILRNPGIESSRKEVEVSSALVTQSKSAYMPQLSANAAYQYGYLSQSAGGIGQDVNTFDAGLMAQQYLYGFGKVTGKIRQSREEYIASQKSLDSTVADVVRDVKRAYFDVLKKQQLVIVNEDSLKTQTTHLEQARAFHKAGVRPLIDVTKGEVAWSQSRLDLITARYNLRLAVVNMEQILGGPPAEGPYTLVDMPARVTPHGPLEPLLETAIALRPEVKNQQARIQAKQAGLRAAKGGYWPTFTAKGEFGWQDHYFPLHNAWLVGANLTWDVFPGLRTVGEVREARASVAVYRSQLRQLELSVIQEVSEAFLLLNEAAETISTAEVALVNAEENMALATGRYDNGVGDAIEYNDAELSLTRAASTLVQARYSYLEAQANLDRAVGMPYKDLWNIPEKPSPVALLGTLP